MMVRLPLRVIAPLFCGVLAIGACDHPTAPSSVGANSLLSTADSNAPVIANLTMSDITRTSAVATWTTNQMTTARIEIDTAGQPSRLITQHISQTRHSFRIDDLLPGSTYTLHLMATNVDGRRSRAESATFTTLQTVEGPSESSLAIATFRMIEFAYPGYPGLYYAPEVEVRETAGANAVVTKLSFTIPGFGAIPPYRTSKCVSAGQQLQLLREVYGDYEFVIDHGGAPASNGQATVEITFEDPAGRERKVTASAPIVPGQLPTSYSSPPVAWPCTK